MMKRPDMHTLCINFLPIPVIPHVPCFLQLETVLIFLINKMGLDWTVQSA